jgi:hypothetical protein
MRHSLLTKFLLLGCAVAAFGPASAKADFTAMYSNVTTFSGFGFAGAGATNVGGDTLTSMVADDINAGPGLGGHTVDQISFSVANLNASVPGGPTTVTARAIVQFYQADGVNGGPGTLITALAFNPIAFTDGTVGLFTFTSPSIFTMPTGTFWAGISFDDNNGTTGATAAQLNNLGQGLFDPPTVGSSTDNIFVSTDGSTTAANGPDGIIGNFGGPPLNPVANLGWSFSTSQAVPEPSTLALSAVGGLVLVGVRLTRRRRSAGDSAIAA